MQRKRKKVSRMRGSHTHGGGAKKKRRGAGHRGGRGNAGSGKRADQKKPSYWKEKYFSGPVFKPINQKPLTMSIAELESGFESLSARKIIIQNEGFFEVSMGKPWKLLSQGKPTKTYFIKTDNLSENAKEKIKKAGGKFLEKQKQKKPEKAPVQKE